MTTLEKLRSYKALDLSLFDIVFGILGMVLIFLLCKKLYFKDLNYRPFIVAGVLLTIPVGIVAHVISGTDTALNRKLGLSY